MKRGLLFVTGLLLTVSSVHSQEAGFSESDLSFFEKEVRPLLVKHCYECHSADSKELKGGLRLDSRDLAIKGGDTGPSISPGNPDKSLLISAIQYGDLYQMPPKSRLSNETVEVFIEWISRGAPWPAGESTKEHLTTDFDLQARVADHWVWHAPQSTRVPRVRAKHWPQQPLDYFLLKDLEKNGLTPSSPADRETLLRRIYFDILGLPPNPDVVKSFIQDSRDTSEVLADAVTEVLNHPAFGERWARHWMDLVRYAESYGHEFDYSIPNAYKYRDYLIRAFNNDVPYNQFIREHIAGDLIPKPRLSDSGRNESILGTGFWWLGEAVHSPVDVRQDQADRIDNQIDVMSKAFMGITLGCARCHDHKFDAITTRDYYSMFGFLASSRRAEGFLYRQTDLDTIAQLKGLQQEVSKSLAGKITPALLGGDDQIKRALSAVQQVLYGIPKEGENLDNNPEGDTLPIRRPVTIVAAEYDLSDELLSRWVQALNQPNLSPSHPMYSWRTLVETPPEALAAKSKELADRYATQIAEREAYDARNPQVANLNQWIPQGAAFQEGPTTSGLLDLQHDVLQLFEPNVYHSGQISNRLRGSLHSPRFTLQANHVAYELMGDGAEVQLYIDGHFMYKYNALLFGGMSINVNSPSEFKWFRNAGDTPRYTDHSAASAIIDRGDSPVVLRSTINTSEGDPQTIAELSPFANHDAPIETAEAIHSLISNRFVTAVQKWRAGTLSASDTAHLNWLFKNRLLQVSDDFKTVVNESHSKYRELEQSIQAPETALIVTDGDGQDERVFVRGNHRVLSEVAPRQIFTAIADDTTPEHVGSGRMHLANEIASSENPLTARTLVNRVWHHLFGRGIVASTNNLGVLGQRPTHPELLDHLATEFTTTHKWSIKSLIRAILLSSAYQMSSTPRQEYVDTDPQNQHFHRQNIRRLQGEAIRDAVLSVSGRLDPALYGPSVPTYLTPFMTGRGRPGQGPIDGNGRRSIYLSIRRNFLSPMMMAFDAPVPFNSVGRRNVSNVPSQALILMNDPFIKGQAQFWAERLVKRDNEGVNSRIAFMFVKALGRNPRNEEVDKILRFLKAQQQEYQLTEEQLITDVRIWADLAHVMFNLKPFTYLY